MRDIALLGFLASAMGFVIFALWFVSKYFPNIRAAASEHLKGRGLRILNISQFHASKALTLASGHVVLVCVVAVIAYSVTRNLFLSSIVGAVIYILPGRWYVRQRKKRRERIEQDLPDALLFISSALRAGSALSVALQILVRDQKGPLGEEFAYVLKEQRLGVPFDDAIQNMSRRINIPDFVLVVVALRVAKEVGGNLSEPLRLLAETLRKKTILEGRIKALTAQGRIQGIVMTLFPVLLLGILYLMQPTMKLLFVTPIGWAVLSVCVVMLFLGYIAIQKIIAIDI